MYESFAIEFHLVPHKWVKIAERMLQSLLDRPTNNQSPKLASGPVDTIGKIGNNQASRRRQSRRTRSNTCNGGGFLETTFGRLGAVVYDTATISSNKLHEVRYCNDLCKQTKLKKNLRGMQEDVTTKTM